MTITTGSGLDRLRQNKKPAERRIPICMDGALVVEIERLKGALNRARTQLSLPARKNDDELHLKVQDLEEQIEAAQATALEHSEWFLVRALTPSDFDRLTDAHPATKEQLKEARKIHGAKAALEFNIDTYPRALIAACTSVINFGEVDPDTGKPTEEYEPLTLAFVNEMCDGTPIDPEDDDSPRLQAQWNGGEVGLLFGACREINQNSSQVNAAGND